MKRPMIPAWVLAAAAAMALTVQPAAAPAAAGAAVRPGAAAVRPGAPAVPVARGAKPVDTSRSGAYEAGKWKYVYAIRAKGTRSERRTGALTYAGQPVEKLAKAEPFDRIRTPWGLMQYVRQSYNRGWLTRLTYDQPLALKKGRLLRPPTGAGPAPPKPIELSAKDNGKAVEAVVGQKIHVRLAGNITTGFSWRLGKLDGEALRQVGRVKYEQRPAAGRMVGVGGTFAFTFEAVRPGKAAIRLEYRRPWEKDKPPIRTFSATFEVRPAKADQGVTGRVLKLTGNHMPTVGIGVGRRGKTEPLSVPVHVFKGALKPLAKPDPKHPALVKTVRSGKDGRYRVPLDPGEYTVVAEIKGKLYLNLLRGDGTWATVTVRKGTWTTWDIRDTSEAAF
jgi:inhibitor of cysteine peptidase